MNMNKEVLERLDNLGGKLENLGSHGYEVLVKHALIQGIVNLGLLVFALLVVVLAVFMTYKSYCKFKKGEGSLLFKYEHITSELVEKTITEVGFVVIGILVTFVAILLLIIATSLPTIIQQVFNPEGYIIKDIINNLKG